MGESLTVKYTSDSEEAKGLRESLGDPAEAAAAIERYQRLAMCMDAERKELVKTYPDQWVAMSEDGIVALADTMGGLFKLLDEKGIRKEDVFHDYMNTKPQTWIL